MIQPFIVYWNRTYRLNQWNMVNESAIHHKHVAHDISFLFFFLYSILVFGVSFFFLFILTFIFVCKHFVILSVHFYIPIYIMLISSYSVAKGSANLFLFIANFIQTHFVCISFFFVCDLRNIIITLQLIIMFVFFIPSPWIFCTFNCNWVGWRWTEKRQLQISIVWYENATNWLLSVETLNSIYVNTVLQGDKTNKGWKKKKHNSLWNQRKHSNI